MSIDIAATETTAQIHKNACEYDGAFWCLDCGAKWGLLSSSPVRPAICNSAGNTPETDALLKKHSTPILRVLNETSGLLHADVEEVFHRDKALYEHAWNLELRLSASELARKEAEHYDATVDRPAPAAATSDTPSPRIAAARFEILSALQSGTQWVVTAEFAEQLITELIAEQHVRGAAEQRLHAVREEALGEAVNAVYQAGGDNTKYHLDAIHALSHFVPAKQWPPFSATDQAIKGELK